MLKVGLRSVRFLPERMVHDFFFFFIKLFLRVLLLCLWFVLIRSAKLLGQHIFEKSNPRANEEVEDAVKEKIAAFFLSNFLCKRNSNKMGFISLFL